MTSQPLHELAELAGLLVEWEDYRGATQTVAPEVLRQTLAALEFRVDDDRAVAQALAAYRNELSEQRPVLLIGQVGQPLRLPPALAGADRGWLHAETGNAPPVAARLETTGVLALDAGTPPGYYRLELGGAELRLALAPAACPSVAEVAGGRRAWGLAAQLYSLRRDGIAGTGAAGTSDSGFGNGVMGDGGVGDFTAVAELARGAAAAGADALAISPVHALFAADVDHYSPYSPSSRLFLNPLHADVAAVLAESGAGGLDPAHAAEMARLQRCELIDWPATATLRLRLLREAWQRVGAELLAGTSATAREFQSYRAARGEALESHARFEAIHARQFAADTARWHWRSWDADLRDPAGATVARFAREHALEVGFHVWLQWLAERGLAAAQRSAREAGMGIGLIADLAVGTDTGGSHAWSYQHDMLIGIAVGAPPDLLNVKGQNWGLTTFSPDGLRHHGYQPFIDMLRACLRHAGGLRIDHILGLRRLWVIPDGCEEGVYLRYPLDDMLKLIALEARQHRAVVCGEDLGTVPAGLRESLADEGILGMRVLWFERDHGLFIDRPRWSSQAMAVTTTHDLPTVAGWWQGRDLDWRVQLGQPALGAAEETDRRERAADRQVLWSAFQYADVAQGEMPAPTDVDPVVDAAIRFVAGTPAPLVIVPMEDLLGLAEQPNLPGTTDQHPNWRRRLPGSAAELLNQPQVQARLAALRQERQGSMQAPPPEMTPGPLSQTTQELPSETPRDKAPEPPLEKPPELSQEKLPERSQEKLPEPPQEKKAT